MATARESETDLGLTSDDIENALLCQPCEYEGERCIAAGFCVDCREYLCQRCCDGHLIPSVTRRNVLLDKDYMPGLEDDAHTTESETNHSCQQHRENNIEFHCPTHSFLGCHLCFFQHQKSCRDAICIQEGAGPSELQKQQVLEEQGGADGTFDILKWADPNLDLGSDNKTIFDDLVEDTKSNEEEKKPGVKEGTKTEVKAETEGADGTFDILKWADPNLDLGSDNKTIFDDLVEDTKSNEEEKKPGVKEGTKTEVKAETEGEEKSDQERPSSVSEYQAKFLEFSQIKSVDENTAAAAGGKKGPGGGKSGEAGSIGQIAALLQGRPKSIKSEGGDGSDAQNAQTPTTPGTPATPGDGSMMRAGYPPGVPSPYQSAMHGQPSPSGLPSPKIMPSPKSMPSRRTPGEVQPSLFSQHSAHSPFSPSATSSSSAPQSPYAGVNVRTQSPFAVPMTTGGQGYINQESPVGSSHSPAHTPPCPMQRSPRANTSQAQQFIQGQFPQQVYLQGPPPRGMPPGQPQGPFNQAGMRQQVLGMRPDTPVGEASPGQPPYTGTEIPQGIRPMHPGMRLERPPFPGHRPTSPGMQGQPPAPGAMYPGGPVRVSQPWQQPQTQPQSFMNQPHMSLPQSTVSAGKPSPTLTTAGQRPSLLEDQPLLIQDLLEQEKLEQQKRQREQQQAMMQRERGGKMGLRPGVPPGMVGMPPGMVPRMEGPARMPTQPPGTMFAQPEMPPGMRPRMPGQLSPHAQGPSQFGIPPGSMAGQGGQMPPPKPPQPGETGPEAERQHMQYDHWLMKHGEYLDMQMKFLDQQIQKQKRTKKAINARNRQAKKNGQEMPPQDVMELERASQEHTMLQKQLEQIQNRQHQITIQDYRGKQQERFDQQQMVQGGQSPPGTMPNMPPGAMPPGAMPPGAMPPGAMPPGSTMQPPQVRMPGMQGSARLTRRQEYDAYMQSRLRQMSQGMVPGMPGQPGGPRPQAPPGQRMALGERFAQQQMVQGGQPPPGTMPNMPPGAMPPGAMPPGAMPPGAIPPGSTMQPPQVRMPGMQGSARLTRRQEYDAYMQSCLRQMSQGMVPGMPGQPGGPRPQAPPGPRMALGERFAQQQMVQGWQPPPGTMPNMPPGAMPPGAMPPGAMPPGAMPPGSTMQPPQVRMPGMQGSARLTATRRQEYDAYMQSRLRQMSLGMVTGMPGQPGWPRPQAPPGPRIALGDEANDCSWNNAIISCRSMSYGDVEICKAIGDQTWNERRDEIEHIAGLLSVIQHGTISQVEQLLNSDTTISEMEIKEATLWALEQQNYPIACLLLDDICRLLVAAEGDTCKHAYPAYCKGYEWDPLFVVLSNQNFQGEWDLFMGFYVYRRRYDFVSPEAAIVINSDLIRNNPLSLDDFRDVQNAINSSCLHKKHSNITVVNACPYRSKRGGEVLEKERCIVVHCLLKGYIQFNEEPFPEEVNSISVDVREGFFQLGIRTPPNSRKNQSQPSDSKRSDSNTSACMNGSVSDQALSLSNSYSSAESLNFPTPGSVHPTVDMDDDAVMMREAGTNMIYKLKGLDIEATPSPYPGHKSKDFNTSLLMGTCIGPSTGEGSGTLGGFVLTKAGKLGALTCAHVISASEDITQPAAAELESEGSAKKCIFGTVISHVFDPGSIDATGVDASIIHVEHRPPKSGQFIWARKEQLKFAGFEPKSPPRFTKGEVLRIEDITPIHRHTSVLKYGAETGLTCGKLYLNGLYVSTANREMRLPSSDRMIEFFNQMEIASIQGTSTRFFDLGDSGSLVFMPLNGSELSCIGLCIGCTSYGSCVVTPIEDVLEKLDLPCKFVDFTKHNHSFSRELGFSGIKKMKRLP